jgi:hypothetical protein
MGDLLNRISRFLFDGARNIDRTILVVDALVLIVIIVEWVRSERREQRHELRELQRERDSSERRRVVNERVAAMRERMKLGQELQTSVPGAMSDHSPWTVAVNEWERGTKELVRSYSDVAETAFLRDTRDLSRMPPKANPMLQITLTCRLSNLQGIIEKPDTYF